MYFMPKPRYNPQTGKDEDYLALKESFKDPAGRNHTRLLLTVGYVPELSSEEIRDVAKGLTYRYDHRYDGAGLFGEPFKNFSEQTRRHIESYWDRMVKNGVIDGMDSARQRAAEESRKMIQSETMKHTDAREVGAEWLCLQAANQLGLRDFLEGEGWSKMMIDTTLSHIITRTIYSPSELRTRSIMEENSSVCELVSGSREWMPSLRSIYEVAPSLLEIKSKLEDYLSSKTDNLFNLTNSIALFDLSNTYFEGRKANSKKAKFGRSKEKRYDCKLLVLALCINKEGFIRYSSILEGNASDPKSLPDMIEGLSAKSHFSCNPEKTLVVIDAGISTEENLRLINDKGYNYLCVSRTRLTDYELSETHQSVTVYDSRKRPITLHEVKTEDAGDYYLQIESPTKAMTEASMNRQWKERFEMEMEKINSAISKKGGVKKYDKVVERVGRVRERYPSISKYYDITYKRSETKTAEMASISWQVKDISAMDRFTGVYFLRTNVRTFDEQTTWDYYNIIREIECTFRQLKTDLNLRPIYHQKDDRSDAHIFLGLLSYWLVNTIRYQLKCKGENCYWTEIVRRMSTQKLVTTKAVNALGENVEMRICSEPTESATKIYDKLGYRKYPFRKMKIRTTQT